jgi:hypothetical protein
MGIAIVGMSPSCKDAPWFDDKWEMWGLPWHAEYWARCDRLFEIHEPTKERDHRKKFIEKAQDTGATLYLREAEEGAVKYPFDKVDCNYFDSSMAYMMALAISENPSKIGLWGIDMNDDQYQHQRPNMEYLIGLARGKGIEVLIHESSPLCKNEINYGLKEWRLPHTQN